MTSAIPGLIAWPVMVAILLVIIGRLWLLNDSPVDRLINRAMIAGAGTGLLLREAWFEHWLARALPFDDDLTIQFARQLSFGSIVLSITYIWGIVGMWGGDDPERTWHQQRFYTMAGIAATIVILIAGTPARSANELIDEYMGWPAVVAWVAFYLPIGIAAVALGYVAIRELRQPDATARERALYIAIIVLAVVIGFDAVATPAVTALQVLADEPNSDPEMQLKSWIFFLATVGSAAAVAIPLVSTALTITGWDRTSRYCRRLRPLWRDLTAAVPEIVLDLPRDEHGRVEPATRLHRMIVEIRDSLLHLKRYSTAPVFADPDPATYAAHIAAAIEAKNSGLPAASLTPAASPVQLGTRDLTGELEQLLSLAELWPRTRA
ncbi:MAB_1171c family putative transporter [Nocardia yamanashiensis]|uniref:MAB_1171c family putative transporter n=1 Tax=Nocardia yamanashiensis TaxID=209247 RepID=UPI000A043959|nr:MAB_1171c family putative transporter [Nocardia yamanashiensis]